MKSKRHNFITIPNTRIPKGVKFSIDNAKRLLNDAKTLHEKGSYSSSIVLSIFAHEEVGKARMLRDKWIKGDDIDSEYWWTNVRKHEIRSEKAIDLVRKKTLGKIKRDEHLEILDKKRVEYQAKTKSKTHKEYFLYVDWSNLGWSYPEEPFLDFNRNMGYYSQLQNLSIQSMNEASIVLSVLSDDEDTKTILQQPITRLLSGDEYYALFEKKANILPYKVLLKFIFQLGEVIKIIITNNESTLTQEDLNGLTIELKKDLPFLESIEFGSK